MFVINGWSIGHYLLYTSMLPVYSLSQMSFKTVKIVRSSDLAHHQHSSW